MKFGIVNFGCFSHGKRCKQSFSSPLGTTWIGSPPITLTSKVKYKWRCLWKTTHMPPTLVNGWESTAKGTKIWPLSCNVIKTSFYQRRQRYHMCLPLNVKCYMVGAHSRCLSEWWQPTRKFSSFFPIMWNFFFMWWEGTTRRIEEEEEEIAFSYGIEATMGWNSDMWRWVEGYHFVNYTTKFGRGAILKSHDDMTKMGEKWQGDLPSN